MGTTLGKSADCQLDDFKDILFDEGLCDENPYPAHHNNCRDAQQ